ncbi:kinase-like domain-containing protein [Mycena pura]|uniref:Kinase-like domain-containing protein n=1 Tax=Mycena pura TaxID=153505 RepID=A0AAD6YRZ6_9AGAR|nr:kinase-like domain-containing protein [Mycena pura]
MGREVRNIATGSRSFTDSIAAKTQCNANVTSTDVRRLGLLESLSFKAQIAYGRRTYGKRASITRISRTQVVKTTSHTKLTEALTLDYIAANTTIPVPRVHRIFEDSRGYLNLVMDYVEGMELEQVWDGMQPRDRLAVMHQLRDYIAQLRKLKPPRPGAVEALNGDACKDFRIRADRPFASVAEFQMFLGRDWFMENKLAEYNEFAPALQRSAARSYRTVFTHCDLAPRNILVKGARIVAIVDLEFGGWYPEYWEYTQAYFSNLALPGAGAGVWELFEEEAFPERYPDELTTEICLASCFERY